MVGFMVGVCFEVWVGFEGGWCELLGVFFVEGNVLWWMECF